MKKVLVAIATLSFVPCAVMADMGSSLVMDREQAFAALPKHAHYTPNAKLIELRDMSNVNLPKSSSSEDLTEEESRQVAAHASASQEETGFFATVKSWFSKACAFVASFF